MTPPNAPSHGPVNWPALIADLRPLYESAVESFDDLPDELLAAKPPNYAGGELGGFDSSVAALALLSGPKAASPLLALPLPHLPRIISQLTDDALRGSGKLPALYTLSYLDVARCCGVELPGDATSLEERWLPLLATVKAKFSDREVHTLALAACAGGTTTLAREFADLPASKTPFAPGESFGFNVPAFVDYLALALDGGHPYEDVEPAWLDFVHNFPYKLDTQVLGWPALMWAARAVYSAIGGLPEGEVADELHRLIAGT